MGSSRHHLVNYVGYANNVTFSGIFEKLIAAIFVLSFDFGQLSD